MVGVAVPVIDRVAELAAEVASWRRDFHSFPELMYDVHRTAGRVVELLTSFGVDEVATGIGRTGVVAVIKGRGPGRTIGLRADMDALPILERTGKPYQSQNAGRMHACGHDGHMAMLLGAAKYLAGTRSFDGTAVLIFQPAEEGGGAGGRAMIEDGLMERFGIEEVYGLHNWPENDAGTFATRIGGLMASADLFFVSIQGVAGHAAMPQGTTDPVLIAAHMIVALQSIVSRNVDPRHSAVVSVTMVNAGEAINVIPPIAKLAGTVRALDENVRDIAEARLKQVVASVAETFGGKADIEYRRDYPVVVNAPGPAIYAARVASEIVGAERVNADSAVSMAAEDFSFMLQARPGALIFLGNGRPSSPLHSDTYDFNDDIIPAGISYWVKLVEGISR